MTWSNGTTTWKRGDLLHYRISNWNAFRGLVLDFDKKGYKTHYDALVPTMTVVDPVTSDRHKFVKYPIGWRYENSVYTKRFGHPEKWMWRAVRLKEVS